MKRFFLPFLLATGQLVHAQGSIQMEDKVIQYKLPEDTALVRILRTNPDYQKLGSNDQQVAYYVNYARRNPKIFLEKAINVFADNHPEVKSPYIGSLQATFKNLQSRGTILPKATISKIAMAHAEDLKAHRSISHSSSNGASFQQRLGSVLNGCGGECVHATVRYNPLEAVLSLLFDFNVPDLGHRKQLLDPRFTVAGFGSAVENRQFSVLVIDFSCQ